MENQEPTGAVVKTDQAGVDNQKSTGAESPEAKVSFWHQLRWTLILNFILLAVLPVAVAVAVILTRTSEQTRVLVINQLDSIAELKRDQIIRWLEDSQFMLRLFLSEPARSNRFRDFAAATLPLSSGQASNTLPENMLQEQAALNALLQDAVGAQAIFEETFLYNAEGYIMAASNEVQIGKIVTRQPYFAQSLVGEFVQTPYYEIGKGELTMFVTQPLVNPQSGRTVGVLAGRLDTSTLGKIMTKRTGLKDDGETYLISPESNYMLTPSRFESEGYVLARAYHSQGIDRALGGENGSGTYDDYRDPPEPVIGVYRWLPELKVAMLAEIDESAALSPFVEARNSSLGVAGVAILLAVAVGLYNATRVSRPLAALTQVASRIAGGHLEQRAEVRQRNEIGLLAMAFNRMTDQLRGLIDTLEERVAERTRRLEIVAGLGEQLSAILNLEELLAEAVNQVKGQFGYYHVHIYLLDEVGENLVVVEGTGPAGTEMKALGHSIPLNAQTSLVARAARSGEVVSVDNVREAPDWLPNPLLPNTYSEMAIPITLGVTGQVVGVLDVQEDIVAGLDESDANLLRSVANQVAVTLNNARLFEQTQTALAEIEATHRRYQIQAWEAFRETQPVLQAEQQRPGVRLSDQDTLSQVKQQVLWQGRTIRLDSQKTGTDDNGLAPAALVTPLKLRGQVIGTLGLQEAAQDRHWTEEEIALLEAVSEQVVQALERARLFGETQRSAWRDRVVSEATAQVWSSAQIEAVMKAAVAQLGDKLKASEVVIRLGAEAEAEQE